MHLYVMCDNLFWDFESQSKYMIYYSYKVVLNKPLAPLTSPS